MTEFSQVVVEFWRTPYVNGDVVHRGDSFAIVVDPTLNEERRVTVVTTADGEVTAALTPELADRLDLGSPLSESAFRHALAAAEIGLHDADALFYFSEPDKLALSGEHDRGSVRRLTPSDARVFAEFESSATEQDLDDAYVELDHWAVFGSFDRERLVSTASTYPWGGARIADVGVLTLPPFRGKGHARAVVRAICRHARSLGYEPQYRCQLDNAASLALATAAGFTRFGTWEVVSPESAN